MDYCIDCPVCGHHMKHNPIKTINSTVLLEYYCEQCGESRVTYEHIHT